MGSELISISEAAHQGIVALRLPKWAHPMDHIRITALPDGSFGPCGARSLCLRWLFTGRSQGPFAPEKKRGPDDCAECDRRARKARK